MPHVCQSFRRTLFAEDTRAGLGDRAMPMADPCLRIDHQSNTAASITAMPTHASRRIAGTIHFFAATTRASLTNKYAHAGCRTQAAGQFGLVPLPARS
jgi:hypothetical protein